MKTSDGLDHQSTPEKQLHQVDAPNTFTMREQALNSIAYIQWHERKAAYIQCSISRIVLS